ncbi:MAG TPA: hypothetical protein V6C81_17630 [Planktothrix sp.]|jgi:hypothetical protein
MDPATFFFLLVPEVLVCFVLLMLVITFSREFMENRRANHIGKNGTTNAPHHYWGRYQESNLPGEALQISSREQHT